MFRDVQMSVGGCPCRSQPGPSQLPGPPSLTVMLGPARWQRQPPHQHCGPGARQLTHLHPHRAASWAPGGRAVTPGREESPSSSGSMLASSPSLASGHVRPVHAASLGSREPSPTGRRSWDQWDGHPGWGPATDPVDRDNACSVRNVLGSVWKTVLPVANRFPLGWDPSPQHLEATSTSACVTGERPGQAAPAGRDTHLLALGALQTTDAICPLRRQKGERVSVHQAEPSKRRVQPRAWPPPPTDEPPPTFRPQRHLCKVPGAGGA